MKSLFLTTTTLMQYLQTLDNLITLKMLDEKGYAVPGDVVFEVDDWCEHILEQALSVLFDCKVIEREISRKTPNGTYQDREMLVLIPGYSEWCKLKHKYPDMEADEEDMRSLGFDCGFSGSGLGIVFSDEGMIVQNGYDTSFYCHSVMGDFFSLKHMWTESLNKWRKKEIEDAERSDRGMENYHSEKAYEASQCA